MDADYNGLGDGLRARQEGFHRTEREPAEPAVAMAAGLTGADTNSNGAITNGSLPTRTAAQPSAFDWSPAPLPPMPEPRRSAPAPEPEPTQGIGLTGVDTAASTPAPAPPAAETPAPATPEPEPPAPAPRQPIPSRRAARAAAEAEAPAEPELPLPNPDGGVDLHRIMRLLLASDELNALATKAESGTLSPEEVVRTARRTRAAAVEVVSAWYGGSTQMVKFAQALLQAAGESD
ncbi:hypothetical protein [Nocardia cyriacigeorgica]|uniref:hypothetical protein n=1 Tax=Nocardia cyriacigeorgica TaxID=135487 RepID=UPI00189330BA|nr:hypothetical protein [Nocardia cyriacigeorgica]MBF6286250.1 hypothetical protein [Nocardia cyriacigeorgica]BDT89308.1 hypothetical protein FMUAM8_50720 [Nocardia cyriacigeorgica]